MVAVQVTNGIRLAVAGVLGVLALVAAFGKLKNVRGSARGWIASALLLAAIVVAALAIRVS